MKSYKDINKQYLKLYHEAQAIMEQAARDLMRRHPKFDSFCAGMGTVTFYNKDQGPLSLDWGYLTQKETKALETFEKRYVYPFDEMFGPTWMPVKFDGPDGERITDW